MTYERFALIYDDLMEDAPYDAWIAFLDRHMKKHGNGGARILDLACGTGELTVRLAEKGWKTTGVDLSETMLIVAQQKISEHGFHVPLFQQDMRELEGLGRFDGVVMFCDSLNYLLKEEDVLRTFERIYQHLEDEGLFMFDVHSLYKMNHVFLHHTYAFNDEDASYIWNCFPGEQENSVEHELTFFVRQQENGLYERFDEFHVQCTFPIAEYQKWLEQCGFQVLQISADFTDDPPLEQSERIFFVCKKLSS